MNHPHACTPQCLDVATQQNVSANKKGFVNVFNLLHVSKQGMVFPGRALWAVRAAARLLF